MSYATNLLSRGEEIVFESRQHWFAVIAQTWVWIVTSLVSLALLIFLASNGPILGNATADQVLTIVLLVALLTYGSTRFRVAAEPAIVVLASVGLAAAWDRARRRTA